MGPDNAGRERKLGLFQATSVGVGAIVGGGILALAGVAFATAGPGAILAFALNGAISLVTVLSFAELSTAFPESGGTYVFARRVLSVGAAFSVGWVVWFASIVAAALYALGFSAFAVDSLVAAWPGAPAWLGSPGVVPCCALAALGAATLLLVLRSGSGGGWMNVMKVAVFAVLIVGGAWAWFRDAPPVMERLTPFLPLGLTGLLQAMGYTYIALQGFDLIAAVAGEVKEPRKVIPRSMLLSLAAAIAIYLPLLLLVAVAGVPEGGSIGAMAAENPETVIAQAAKTMLGPAGFWLVMTAGILSMLSAMMANLFAGSRIAQAMGRDRTLPASLEEVSAHRGTPANAVMLSGLLAGVIVMASGDVAAAGAAASLIFLVSFALAHLVCILARMRQPDHRGYRAPGWPWVPAAGGIACLGLAVFQGAAVPAAGLLTGAWLAAGFFSYLWVFGRRARIIDASSEAGDPDLLELRGRSPLALVPVANPANARTLALLAACLSPPRVGRVLFLNVVRPVTGGDDLLGLDVMAEVLRRSMEVSVRTGIRVESLATVSSDPWAEIARVARTHRCAVTLLGMTTLSDSSMRERLEKFAGGLPGNIVILRAPVDWDAQAVTRILVPIGGKAANNALRARLLTSLVSHAPGEVAIRYLCVVPVNTPQAEQERRRLTWSKLVRDETGQPAGVEVTEGGDVAAVVADRAKQCDVVILGLGRSGSGLVFSDLITAILDSSDAAVMLIGQRD